MWELDLLDAVWVCHVCRPCQDDIDERCHDDNPDGRRLPFIRLYADEQMNAHREHEEHEVDQRTGNGKKALPVPARAE